MTNFADTVIVGAGPVGLILASAIAQNDHRVLLLDSTDSRDVTRSWTYVNSNVDYKNVREMPSLHAIGAHLWGGACTGYPSAYLSSATHSSCLTPSKLRSAYSTVSRILGIKNFDLETNQPSRSQTFPRYRQTIDDVEYAYVLRDPGLKSLQKELARSPRIVTMRDAVVTKLSQRNGTIEVRLYRNQGRQEVLVTCKRVFLSAGCVENTRLLLSSQVELEVTSGSIGKRLSDHLTFPLATARISDPAAYETYFGNAIPFGRTHLWGRFSPGKTKTAARSTRKLDYFVYGVPLTSSPALPPQPSRAKKRGRQAADCSKEAAEPNRVALRVFAEVPNSTSRRIELGGSGLPTVNLRQARHHFLITESEFSEYAQLAIEARQAIGHLPFLDDLAPEPLDRSHMQTSNHPSGTYAVASDDSPIDERTLALKSNPGVFPTGAGLLPRASAVHPTFISAALAVLAAATEFGFELDS